MCFTKLASAFDLDSITVTPHIILLLTVIDCIKYHKPRLHGDSDQDPDPDWFRLHGGKLDSNPDSDHLSHVDCDLDSNPDSGPGARVNAAIHCNTM